MSLTRAQRSRTATEFAANLAASGLTREGLRRRTDLPPARFDAALTLAPGADPRDVWQVRDALETAVRDSGEQLTAFSVLTEDARSAAGAWFGVTDRR